uniref:Solute carrier family 25 member 40 n=1 Tax=Elaeophora elaphi TaxID=1147741 RepID=A0A158Q8T8_9BILA
MEYKEEVYSSATTSFFQQMIAASSGAIVTSLLMTPMDVVKIRLQQQAHPFVKGTCFLYSNGLMDHLCTACANVNSKEPCEWFARPGNFTGTVDALFKITRTEGIRSLWSGLSPTLVMAIPATVLYYTIYDNMLCWLKEKYSQKSHWVPLVAGSVARLVALTIVSPMELIRTKMQSERLTYKDIGLAIQRSKVAEGWSSLWRGWSPSLMRDMPFSAVYWTGYEFLKTNSLQRLNQQETNFLISFGCGAVAGSLAAFVTTPFDVVKTRRQITLGKIADLNEVRHSCGNMKMTEKCSRDTVISKRHDMEIRSKHSFDIMKELYEKNGFRALFAGVIPRVTKVSLACAMMIGSYEYCKLFFKKLNSL